MNTKKSAGFSIVELILAIIVGAVLFLAINVITTDYLHLGQRSRNLVLANSFTEGKVEALRNIGYSGLTTGTTDISSELPADLQSPKSASLQISDSSSGLKKVDITVNYTDQTITRTYSYSTYIGELGVGK